MSSFNRKRLGYLFPVLLAALCLALGVTLTGALENARAATRRTTRALSQVQRAAELVSELRFGSAEHLAVRSASLSDEWRRLEPAVAALGRDKLYGSEVLREQAVQTSALIDRALGVARPAGAGQSAESLAQAIAIESSAVWAGWHSVEGLLTQRLIVELNGPGNQASSVALLSALGCFCCAILLWQTWQSAQRGSDAAALESQLRESESRYRAMAESAQEILVQADPSGKILRSNRPLTATSLAELFDSPEPWNRLLASLRDGAPEALAPREVWLAGSDSGKLMEWRVAPVRNAAGTLVRVDSALLDITAPYSERQAAQVRFSALEQNLRRSQRQVRELLDQSFELAESRTAMKRGHEARMEALFNWGARVAEPLRAASDLTGRLRDRQTGLGPEESAILASAVESVAASLRSLSTFAGLERGPLTLVAGEFEPHSLLEDCLEAVAERAAAKHLELPCFVHKDVPRVAVADSSRLREALGCLLEHALAHTDCGEVSARLATASQVGAVVNFRFEIEDTGSGFSPDHLASLLEPFHPDLAPYEVASQLAVARKLIERMGGQFGAESEPGHGTRVWLVVPAQLVPASIAAGEPPWPPPELANKRIMVVADSASQRGALVQLSLTLGMEATTCASAESALEELRQGHTSGFDFLLVDHDALGARGPGLAAWIAAHSARGGAAGAPTVFLMAPRSHRSLTLSDCPPGVRGMISKPVRRAALVNLLLGNGMDVTTNGEGSPAAGRASASTHRRWEEASAARAGSPIVLVVEDNLVNQRVAVRLVEKMGYRTAVVNNGLEAIQAIRGQNFDLILMDCQMPELDGFTATAEIRRLETTGSHVPIIAMTANAMRGDREKCLASGMDDYISKPVAFEDLRVLIAHWLARAEAARH